METEQTYIPATRIIRLQTSFWDIYDLLLLIWISPLLPLLLVLPLPTLRVPVGLGLVLFAPGYALAAALFPRRDDLDGIARAALSFGLSVAVLPVLALVLDVLPWGIRPWPMALALALWIALFCASAIGRRLALARSGVAVTPLVVDPRSQPRGKGTRVSGRHVAGALAVAAALIAGASALTANNTSARPTEFYVLGAQGLAQDYPRQATPGDQLTVTLGIVNQERDERLYRVEIWAFDPDQPDHRMLVKQVGSVALAAGERLEQPVTWQAPWADGDQEVEFLLFLSDNPTPYRRLHVSLDVTGPPAALR